MFTLISPPCLFLPPGSILPWYLLDFENYSIQFPAFSLNMQTIQQERSKDSFMALRRYQTEVKLTGGSVLSSAIPFWKANLYPNPVLPKIFVPYTWLSNFNTKTSWFSFLVTKFHPHLGPLNWASEWPLHPNNKWEGPTKLLWSLTSNIISKYMYCCYKPVHPFWKLIWLRFLTCCWYTHNLALCINSPKIFIDFNHKKII